MFKTIQFTNPHRKKHFEFFRQMDNPHFNICANVDITNYMQWLKALQIPFTPAMVYALSTVANLIPAFRQRIRGEAVVEHEAVHPSFSVATEISDVFSFCYVPYQKDFDVFVKDCLKAIEKMKINPSFEDEEGRDDYLFMSSFPWVSFTSFQHAMHYSPGDSVPRIAWGKFFVQNGKTMMPLSVQAHHAIVDGAHVGQYFQQAEVFFNELR